MTSKSEQGTPDAGGEHIDPETGEITTAKVSELAAYQPTEDDREALRTRKVLTLRQLLPDENWIARNVTVHGKGAQAWVGRVYGQADSFEEKTHTQSDGRVTQSIALRGKFEAESFITNEIQRGTTCYLPLAYAEQAAAVFRAAEPGAVIRVDIDCDVGLEATGKTIPYEWVTIAHLDGKEMDVLRAMRNRRGRPAGAPPAPARLGQATAAPALEAPAGDAPKSVTGALVDHTPADLKPVDGQ